jgi:hypothetical protein
LDCRLGGGRITVTGKRAIAQTKMTIMQRGAVHDVVCDVTCTGRFYDFLERRAGRWAIVLRQPIYEKDRIDPVDPAVACPDDGVLPALGSRSAAQKRSAPQGRLVLRRRLLRHMPGRVHGFAEDLLDQWLRSPLGWFGDGGALGQAEPQGIVETGDLAPGERSSSM